MKIIKRNGSEAEFNLEKIRIAVTKANNTVPEHLQMKNQTIEKSAKMFTANVRHIFVLYR